MDQISITTEIILIVIAFIAGGIDAIAGGGGLIVMPVLLQTGMPIVTCLGTSKLQALFGSGSATLRYAQQGLVDLKSQWKPAALCVLLSFAGANLVSFLPKHILEIALPVILIMVAIYFAISKKLSDENSKARMDGVAYGLLIAPLIAFYDGIFGPGAGTFYMIGFVLLAGYGMTRATAHTKFLNFASNIGAFIAFAMLAQINYKLGLMMGVAQFFGARMGSGLAIKGGSSLIRPLLVITSIALALKLLWPNLRDWL